MHPLMEALAGTWRGGGRGEYPTIETFDYREEVSLTPLAGKPILAYSQRTHGDDGQPLHAESGYYRFDESGVELVIAQPTGVAEAHRGTAERGVITLEPTGLSLTPTAIDVKEIRRVIRVEGDVMDYRLEMSAVGQPLILHLEAKLRRTD